MRPPRTVLVTGASRGLGRALVKHYLNVKDPATSDGDVTEGEASIGGWRVVACCRDDDTETVRRGFETELGRPLPPGQLCVVRLDVTDPESFANLESRLGSLGAPSLDVIINNAAVCVGRECSIGAGIDYDAWRRSFDTNVVGVMRVTRACLPWLAPEATVVNVSGRMGSIGRVMAGLGPSSSTTQDVVYRTTKAALNMLTVCAAAELRSSDPTKGVKVIAINPGWMNTEMGTKGGTVRAPLEPETSAAGIARVVEGLSPEDSGRFLDWQGEEMPW